jgi:hypothetical protein
LDEELTTLDRLAADEITMVIMALQSDPQGVLEVKATEGNALGEPYNVGLIEVTALTPEGRGKMRSGLRWLILKLEQRMRECKTLIGADCIVKAEYLIGRTQRKASLDPSSAPVTVTDSTVPSLTDDEPKKSPIMNRHLEVVSPDSDTSSGADRVMWHRRSRIPAVTHNPAGEAESDTRSSSSSLQWMMKGAIQNGLLPTTPDATADPVLAAEANLDIEDANDPAPPLRQPGYVVILHERKC